MRLTAPAALRIATYLLVADGLAALWVGGLLGTPTLALTAVVVAGSWWQPALGARVGRVAGLGPALAVLAAAALAVDIAWLAPTMLDGFTHLLLVLLVYRLYTRRSLRDARDIAFLAFFMLVAVAPLTFGVSFLFLVLVFVVAGTWLLLLRHVLAETEPASLTAVTLGLGRGLTGLGIAASLATVAVATALFFVIPRVGQAALPLRAPPTRLVTGFTERVELGAFGEIETDSTIVMRVHLPGWPVEAGSPSALENLRWRGIAFDRFDGRTWAASPVPRLTLRRSQPVPFPLNRYRGGPLLTQEIFLEPLGSEVIFGAPRVVRLQGRSDVLTFDELGTVSLPTATARLRYTVDSEPEAPDPRGERWPDGGLPADPAWRARYLQLPPLAPRIPALAREITSGSADPYEAARRLTAYLRREFRYTLALERRTSLDPVEEFLFVRRAGNCEYFAAALAVMLRSLGIPARVVNGFQRGEWNPYGGYFMVRLSDAHSWVETFVEGSGWVTLDPSPRVAAGTRPGLAGVWLYADALRLRWYLYVINWSLHDQLVAALTVRRTASALGAWRLSPPDWSALPRPALAVVVLAVATALLAWHRWRRASAGPASRVPGFYARALRAVARRGLRPAGGETAREFARRVARQAPAWDEPLTRLTTGYERVRFGAAALTAAEAAELEACLAALGRAR